jgi:predicted metalloprotease with PDZ domain
MRDVNLAKYQFDYDLTWAGLFVSPDGRVLGRYGGRDADSADGKVSLKGLRYAMEAALKANRERSPQKVTPERRTVADYPGFKRLGPSACVHCHQVHELQRDALQARGGWSLDKLWVYPPPENVGLTLEVERGNVVARVGPKSAAEKAGLRQGDVIRTLGGEPVASFADAQYALHRHESNEPLAVVWVRDGKEMAGKLELADGWRKSDISWRWSLRQLEPSPWVHGDDLTPQEKKALGLGEKRLALRQGNFVTAPARQAGVRQNDIIVGVDGKELEMTGRQFPVYVKLNYKVGDKVTYNLLRDGKRVDVVLTLAGRP